MSTKKVNREAMYRVLKFLWFTLDKVNFVALNEEAILVKFGNTNDRTRILNLTPWLFDQSLLVILPFVKGQELDYYVFNITPFWIRIYNIPFEKMDRQVAIDIEKAIREVMEIDWRDKDGGWIDYIRIRVKIDVLRTLRRVAHLVRSEGTETVCAINSARGSTQNRENWGNGIEILEKKISSSDKNNDKKIWNGDENDFMTLKGKEEVRCGEEESESRSLMEKYPTKLARDGRAE
ncbi:hypothetical protein Gohar_000833 [Gossypium harknessii]|uniref:DUF4283 domain-containing protein n=1 Tax=Gossypium harknessii TaxID=34285 RepID=A0A7J9I1Z1_9ROSI|nr:hypothetical protein [Gossypium harknessii]